MSGRISLRAEPCPICKCNVVVQIAKEDIAVDVTGLCIILDVHGLNHEIPHIRTLYVDSQGSVRSYTIHTRIVGKEK